MVAAAVCGLTLLAGASATAAAQAPSLGPDGETAPVYSYTNAIRERVWVPVAGVDQDADGVTDRVALDIMRPAEAAAGPVPAIIYTSPYLTSVGEINATIPAHDGGRRPTASRCSTTTTSSRAATRSSSRTRSAPASRPAARCTAGPATSPA